MYEEQPLSTTDGRSEVVSTTARPAGQSVGKDRLMGD